MGDKVQLLHTNDMHSHLERWPRIRRFLKASRSNANRAGMTSYTFDIGDALDREHPLTDATMGRANVQLLNQGDYTAVTIGNNEDLGMTHDALNHLYDQANFPVIITNVLDMATEQVPVWAQASKTLVTRGGKKIAVLAMTAPFIRTLPLLGWAPLDVMDTLATWIPKLKENHDAIVLLSHLGLPTDRDIATKFEDINVILGAHTHHLLPEGEYVGKTLLAAAGRHGDHVGEVTLEFEDDRVTAEATVYPVAEMPRLFEDEGEINGYRISGDERLKREVITEMPTVYSNGLTGNHRVIDLGLEALEAATDTDIAMLSTGLFLTDLPVGTITKKTLHDMLPHAIHPMRTELLGSDLIRLLKEIKKNQPFLRMHRQKGMGFRGQEFGTIVFSGITEDNGTYYVHDEPIELTHTYHLGSLDHFLFIPYFPTLEIAGDNTLMYDQVLRETFGNYLKNKTEKE
ncbi:bifunctional metallophosphatase/5'-nucleotidase [Weissella ceti]|uniref:Bifunctional metallophosphatase/5'-nucleotidase n=1 Tax=Weissella ceti TaxID=759620 RepID=A0ABT3E299_9LACO|nr:bifunctional UDP-sugar hydrolase/5'-nucleotidase [Weissella ceti]MCW0952548.1 bifunctional metallophosphatase/5'-nucleotidase [Weissella ceti]QVK11786.1 bifunctional metallophosphatase/5'-nucleotidase [Weissella ceti]